MGNLVLFDTSNTTVWQSFDHPTDSLVFGQTLNPRQKLTASISTYNSSRGRYKFSPANTTQFIKLEPGGHLKVYAWGGSSWGQEQDLLTNNLFGDCGYPMVCGKYGICSDGQCSCSQQTDFSQINFRQPNLGCSLNIPISCDFSQYHKLVELKDIDYFVYRSDLRDEMMELEDCMNTCLKNCTCKAAVFAYNSDPLRGGCLLLSEVFSLINIQSSFHLRNSSMFVKVQTSSSGSLLAKKSRGTPSFILGASLGAFIGVLLMMGACFFLVRRITTSKEVEEDYLDQVPGMPTRFAYKNLKDVTENFNKKLGEGGFGSVFEWTLSNGTKVAVKHLSALGQVKKSFLAEIETIGSIHHVNLPEEDKHLLCLFQRKARGGQLSDMVDKCSEDMQLHGPEIVETMRLADWCLQSDFKRRPYMSTVVKVLEGYVDVESDLDYNFVGQHLSRTTATICEKEDVVRAATPLLPSVLSGPR
ncbi:unnamed protein product [Ilex paraguariensis]|uniref:Apple domain-containing protein n=1 Tax=Ilex paraguariensis TaxID=185542 RepID=A0ABC8T1B3_9AQUA